MSGADVIASIATPTGNGGIGVIRISGSNLARLTALFPSAQLPLPRQAHYTPFVDKDGHIIDQGLALYFIQPHSFTGEHVLELHAHGGYFVLQQLLARCFELGARQAQAGEFTLRAFLNDKIDLLQAEAIADIILAKSDAAARAAARSLQGDFSKAVFDFNEHITTVRVNLESSLDFSDDDANTTEQMQATNAVKALQSHIQSLIDKVNQGIRVSQGIKAVIIGAPNVGKSSLFNRLTEKNAAIVSNSPGTTRDIIEQHIVINSINIQLIDGAGIRTADHEVEQEGIRRILAQVTDANIILSVYTHESPPIEILNTKATIVLVRNKVDTHPIADTDELQSQFAIAAKTGIGIEELKRFFIEYRTQSTATDEFFSARTRHLQILQQCNQLIARAADALDMPEVAAAWLKDTHTALQSLTGQYDEEQLLGDIFSKFCIGK